MPSKKNNLLTLSFLHFLSFVYIYYIRTYEYDDTSTNSLLLFVLNLTDVHIFIIHTMYKLYVLRGEEKQFARTNTQLLFNPIPANQSIFLHQTSSFTRIMCKYSHHRFLKKFITLLSFLHLQTRRSSILCYVSWAMLRLIQYKNEFNIKKEW